MKNIQTISKGSIKPWLIVLLAFIVLMAGLSLFLYKTDKLTFINRSNQREAIFLTNGQVYFGLIQKEDDHYLVIKDIYYLKTQDQLSSSNAEKKVSIIKLGDEVHGPKDIMYISRDQVLFYEPMRDNSKINEAIKKYAATNSTTK